jgi:type IV pilus assembly protein PilB
LTGHIVLSTLHTNDALGVIPRLIDMGVEKYLIPPTLVLAAAQRLLRRLCEECKIKDTANVAETRLINDALDAMPAELAKSLRAEAYELYRPNQDGQACKVCGGKAFKGRIGIYEMLRMTPELEQIILTSVSESALKQEARRQGMVTMFQDGIMKVLRGVASMQELVEIAQAIEGDQSLEAGDDGFTEQEAVSAVAQNV